LKMEYLGGGRTLAQSQGVSNAKSLTK
jgi:hypothetical protein